MCEIKIKNYICGPIISFNMQCSRAYLSFAELDAAWSYCFLLQHPLFTCFLWLCCSLFVVWKCRVCVLGSFLLQLWRRVASLRWVFIFLLKESDLISIESRLIPTSNFSRYIMWTSKHFRYLLLEKEMHFFFRTL
jgi:hypothetical protein